ncbi:hypothetical protein VaNZ11_016993 [Volvox africanus]|uniref:lipoyl(octanoyl) transferase n=1 Tax=Volvox africanus TaxID=51714 RepID=A0ABQ5SNU6_9CHLO|nr:hypothetical protein VaNZ11_016993 [Volvox africanus]
MLRPLRVINLASTLTNYTAGLRLQDSLVEERRQGLVDDTLILLQHYPVYTLGKRGNASDFRTPQKDLVKIGAEICSVPRGGELTFHGPGQLVAYPIIGVKQAGLGARAFVEGLEDSIVDCLAIYGINARGRVPGATGVWVGARKIAAIGVRISHGVSSHGLALNIETDLSYFQHIVPCGISDKEVTSLRQELETQGQGLGVIGLQGPARIGTNSAGRTDSNFAEVVGGFIACFQKRFGFSIG